MIEALLAVLLALGAALGFGGWQYRRGRKAASRDATEAARERERARDEIHGEIVSVDPDHARERLRDDWRR